MVGKPTIQFDDFFQLETSMASSGISQLAMFEYWVAMEIHHFIGKSQ